MYLSLHPTEIAKHKKLGLHVFPFQWGKELCLHALAGYSLLKDWAKQERVEESLSSCSLWVNTDAFWATLVRCPKFETAVLQSKK